MPDAAGYKLERYDDILRNNRQVYEWTDISDEIKASSTSYEETSGELVCGQSHEYRVSAKGDGSPYSTDFGATASDSAVIACPVAAPTPEGLTADTTGPQSIRVRWKEVEHAEDYSLQRYGTVVRGARDSRRQVLDWIPVAEGITNTHYDVTAANSNELNPIHCGQTHQFRVSAQGDGWPFTVGYENYSPQASGSTEPCPTPPAPTGVTAVEAGPTSITVSWDARDGVRFYLVERFLIGIRSNDDNSQSTRSGWAPVGRDIEGTSHTVKSDDLTCGDDHRFQVSGKGDGSVYAAEYGDPSEEAIGRILCPPTVPILSISAASEDSITLRWPRLEGVTYVLEYVKDGSTVTRDIEGTADHVVSGLTKCTEYNFAVTGTGDGTNYAARPGTTGTITGSTVCPAPPPVSGLTVTNTSTNSITISWTGKQGVKYVVDGPGEDRMYSGAGTLTHEEIGLMECREYTFTVSARGDGVHFSDEDDSVTSATITQSTVCPVPPPTPSLSISNTGATSITISWTGVQSVTYTVDGPGTDKTYSGTGTLTHEEIGLMECTEYSFTVTARGDGKHYSNRPGTESSVNVTGRTLPCEVPAPNLNVVEEQTTRESITLRWESKDEVTYEVSYVVGDTTPKKNVEGTGGTVTAVADGLMCGNVYTFRAKGMGDGWPYKAEYGNDATLTDVSTLLCVVPEHTLNISDPTRTTLKVSWTGLPDLSYDLDHRLSTTGGASGASGARSTQQLPWKLVEDSITVPTSMSSTVERVVENLPCGSSIDFRLRILSLGGEYPTGSTREDTGNGNTAPCGPPPMPTGLVATPTAQNSITVSWNTDPNVARYRLEYAATPTPTFTVVEVAPAALAPTPTPTPTTHTVSGLQLCNTDYRFRVSGMGYGSPYSTDYGESAEITSSIPCPAPAPANVIATPIAQDKITVSWDTDGSVASYKLEYAVAGTPTPTWSAVATVTPAPASTPTSYEVTSTSTRTLTCGTEYLFRVSAIGDGMAHNGITYSSFRFGDTSDPLDPSAAAKTDFFCTPQNLTVTPLSQRRARLSWDQVDNRNKYFVQVVKLNEAFPTATPVAVGPNVHDTGTSESYPIELDKILNTGTIASPTHEGLAHSKAYRFRVGAEFTLSGNPKTFFSDAIVIIDSPIVSANGHSPSPSPSPSGGTNDGKAALKWTHVKDILNDTDYANGTYSFRYRRFTDFDGHPHTDVGWQPGRPAQAGPPIMPEIENFVPADTHTVDTFQGGAAIAGTDYTIGSPHTNGLTLYEIYAIQLRYTVTVSKPGEDPVQVRVFAGRDAYVWPSDDKPEPGKKVATYPFIGHFQDKTYTYRICKETFRNKYEMQTSDVKKAWEELIVHALGRWQEATRDSIVITMARDLSDCIEPKTPPNLASLLMTGQLVGILQNASNAEAFIDNVTNKLGAKDDGESEVLMVDPATSQGQVEFSIGEMVAEDVFKACIWAGFVACVSSFSGATSLEGARTELSSSDIIINYQTFQELQVGKLATPSSVEFNRCDPSSAPLSPDDSDEKSSYLAYSVVVHEGGHALGLSGIPWLELSTLLTQIKSFFLTPTPSPTPSPTPTVAPSPSGTGISRSIYEASHPSIVGAVMNYDGLVDEIKSLGEPDCAPHPLDVLAIHALYQSLP